MVLSGAAVDKLELELVPVERVLLATTLMSEKERCCRKILLLLITKISVLFRLDKLDLDSRPMLLF